MIWGLLTSRLAGPIGAGLSLVLMIGLLASCGVQKAQKREIGKLRQDLAEARESYRTCKGNRLALEASLAAQNRAVAALGEESLRRQRDAAAAVSQAQRGRQSAEAKAARLLSAKPEGVDSCARVESADRALLEALR